MAYFENINIKTADGPAIDAFGRWRISSPTSLFDSKQIMDYGDLYWSTKIVGNATASYNQNAASTYLINSGSNSLVIRQTKRRFNYQPGKSALVVCTSNFADATHPSAIETFGCFDESNGMYFRISGSSAGVGIRNKVTGQVIDTFISQSSWNLDKMDGTGPSEKILNWSASQIYFLDYEWLGVGRVRYGIFQDGYPTYIHQITNFNILSQNNPVYISTPNLPVRYESINSGSSPTTLVQICTSVISEGGYDQTGTIRSVDIAESGTVAVNTGLNTPLLAIRLKSSSLGTTISPIRISTLCANNHRYALLLNPPTSSNFTFNSVQNSAVEWALGTGAATLTSSLTNEGIKITSGYVDNAISSIEVPIDTNLALGSSIDGVRDVMVLTMINYAGNNTGQASLTWRETV